MRLRERELVSAYLRKRSVQSDALGGRPELFCEERTAFRASLLPEGGEMQYKQRGLRTGTRLRLLTGLDLKAEAGDGVWIGEDGYVILRVERWTALLELLCEALK